MRMDATGAGSLPRHIYCFADRKFIRKNREGFEPAVWFGLTSVPGRMWGCTVLLECGAIYRSLPPHAIAFSPEPQAEWTEDDAEEWDCYGWRFSLLEYAYLSGLRAKVRCGGHNLEGEYLFTAIPIGDGFSMVPEQQKEFTFVKLVNGRLTIQPTNRILLEDLSFTTGLAWPIDLKPQTDEYTCE